MTAMLSAFWNSVKGFVAGACASVASFFAGFMTANLKRDKKDAQDDAKHYKKQAQKLADAGLKPTPRRLRDLAATKPRDS